MTIQTIQIELSIVRLEKANFWHKIKDAHVVFSYAARAKKVVIENKQAKYEVYLKAFLALYKLFLI